MSKRIMPTSKQKTQLVIHAIIFVVVNALLWVFYDQEPLLIEGSKGWAYPWPSWITAAWALALIGHWAALFTSYEDKGHAEFVRQAKG